MTDVSRKQGQYSVIVRSLLYVHPRTAIYAPTSCYTIVMYQWYDERLEGKETGSACLETRTDTDKELMY